MSRTKGKGVATDSAVTDAQGDAVENRASSKPDYISNQEYAVTPSTTLADLAARISNQGPGFAA
jgi:hypothetical protein